MPAHRRPSSLHDPRYVRVVALLVERRKAAQLSQRDVAGRLKRPASYVAKIETLEKRLDIVELADVLAALKVDLADFLDECATELRKRR